MKTIKGSELADKEFEILNDGTLRLIENKPKKFIPNTGEEYWYIHNLGSIESTLNDGNVKRYLVTYFCPMYRKPQSKQLTDTDVVTYMSKGDFNKLCKKCGGVDVDAKK